MWCHRHINKCSDYLNLHLLFADFSSAFNTPILNVLDVDEEMVLVVPTVLSQRSLITTGATRGCVTVDGQSVHRCDSSLVASTDSDTIQLDGVF